MRVLVSFLAAATVWLVAGQARAAAPQCDARGAITFAPNPTLEEPNASVDVGQTDDCSGKKTDDPAYRSGRSPLGVEATDALAKAALASVLGVVDAAPVGLLPEAPLSLLASRLERDRLDRPPR